ncbi:isochorismate synthase [Nonomuraea sp. NPDC050202]|uniref:isochorismate synthase n=1 Tax=Nonomuraea sp. NPDC050202 TaxID=3155035 RepID=UPI00341020DB
MPPKAPALAEYVAPAIRDYRPGDTLFAGPTATLLAHNGEPLTGVGLDYLPDALAALLARRPTGCLAVGAVSFDGLACRLTLCDTVTRAGPLPRQHHFRCGVNPVTITAVPSEEDYVKAVRRAIDRIAAGELDKAVLSRALAVTSARRLSVPGLLRHLGGHGYTFAVPIGTRRTLIGASPELLISRRTRDGISMIVANPLAGSTPRGAGPAADRQAAQELLASAKDRHEHRLVVEEVARALDPFCRDLHVPAEPTPLATPTLWHLSTLITGTLADPAPSSLALAAALHPTPAIAGTPTKPALALISELEGGGGVERGYYCGLVGWTDATGDGEWALALRCAVLDGDRRLRLYAGAGIVADSDPAAELAETNAKFGIMLDALDVRPAR